MDDDMKVQMLFESDSMSIYRIEDEDGEVAFDINLFDTITIHLVKEEWNELAEAIGAIGTEN